MDEAENALSSPTRLQFGLDWPGHRCGAKTRRGTACLKPAFSGKNRCQLHGGKSTGVKGERNGNYGHGRYTKEAIANRRAANGRVRGLIREAKALGLLD